MTTNTDPTTTHMDKRLSLVDDYSTNGVPDTMKILPDLQKRLRAAQQAQRNNFTLERDNLIRWLKGKVNQYQTRARARQR